MTMATVSLDTLQRALILCAKPVLSLREAAEWMDMSPRSFGAFYRSHGIPARKHGQKLFFLNADLERWMMAGEMTTGAAAKEIAESVLDSIGITNHKRRAI